MLRDNWVVGKKSKVLIVREANYYASRTIDNTSLPIAFLLSFEEVEIISFGDLKM